MNNNTISIIILVLIIFSIIISCSNSNNKNVLEAFNNNSIFYYQPKEEYRDDEWKDLIPLWNQDYNINDYKLLDDPYIYSPQGTPFPLHPSKVVVNNEYGPTVNGDINNNKNSLFMFSYNKVSPSCCSYNGEYSTSGGCVCITPEQKQFLAHKGSNKTIYDDLQ